MFNSAGDVRYGKWSNGKRDKWISEDEYHQFSLVEACILDVCTDSLKKKVDPYVMFKFNNQTFQTSVKALKKQKNEIHCNEIMYLNDIKFSSKITL